MASTPTYHRNEETEFLIQNEGTIASRLRSSFKVEDVKTYQTTREIEGNPQFFSRVKNFFN